MKLNYDQKEIQALFRKFGKENPHEFAAALAANMEPMVQTEIESTMASDLFLETRIIVPGESTDIFIEDGQVAYVVNPDGSSGAQPIGANKLQPPEVKADILLVFDEADLDRGVIRPLNEQGDNATSLIKERLDELALALAVDAVTAVNTVESPGGVFTEQAAKQAIVKIEDLKKEVGSMFARSTHIKLDMSDFDLGDQSKEEMTQRGAVKVWAGTNVVPTAKMAAKTVLFASKEKVGRMMITYGPTVRPHYGAGVEPGYIGLYAQVRARIGIGKPSGLAVVNIID